MRLRLFFPVFIFALLKPVYSETQNLTFKHLTTDRGLSNNTVHCVFQDSKGFMWFGTDDGLNMFNGYEFRIFNNIANDSTSLVSNIVFKIAEDSKGNLWIGTDNGLDI